MKRPTEDQALELHELVGKSDMTLGELITSYRQAPKKNLQLHALAELTLLSEEQIKDLLLANGVKPQELPKQRAPRKPKEQPEAKTPTTPPEKSGAYRLACGVFAADRRAARSARTPGRSVPGAGESRRTVRRNAPDAPERRAA